MVFGAVIYLAGAFFFSGADPEALGLYGGGLGKNDLVHDVPASCPGALFYLFF